MPSPIIDWTKRAGADAGATRQPLSRTSSNHHAKRFFHSMVAPMLIVLSCINVLGGALWFFIQSTLGGVHELGHQVTDVVEPESRSNYVLGPWDREHTKTRFEKFNVSLSSEEANEGGDIGGGAATGVQTLAPHIPSAWGVCDPRVVNKYYKPAGKIWIVSFAGWDERRKQNLVLLKTELKNRTAHQLETLFYTEADLPQDYYDDFRWAFAKPDYRGFWSWKPWILRNLTETGVFHPQDLVFWIDSDERIMPDTPYFETALCNMELRNNNFGGIYPFERCFNHQESRFTKPAVFQRMGLDVATYGSKEQIYAGALGFRVIEYDTLTFLSEWENWARDPVMFGNDQDFSDNSNGTVLPQNYKQHKNDQSVFSLMVHSRNMVTWPAPYYWYGDSGVEQCLDNFKKAGYCFFFDRKNFDYQKICQPFQRWLEELEA